MKYTDRIAGLISDRKSFDAEVYTPIGDAIVELEKRWNDPVLEKKIDSYLCQDIPLQFKNGFRFVLFRHLCTPNYEMNRFVSATDAFGWKPVFAEYPKDKFTPQNLSKYYLGKVCFHFGHGKKGGGKMKYINLINFNDSNGKPISSINTLWGQSLKDFHREWLLSRYPQFVGDDVFFDSSEWFKNNGGSAKEYYKKLLALFIRHGILFENFLLSEDESVFTRDYFLPAFLEVYEKMGAKPLIIALSPTEIESNEFWLCYPGQMIDDVNKKLSL